MQKSLLEFGCNHISTSHLSDADTRELSCCVRAYRKKNLIRSERCIEIPFVINNTLKLMRDKGRSLRIFELGCTGCKVTDKIAQMGNIVWGVDARNSLRKKAYNFVWGDIFDESTRKKILKQAPFDLCIALSTLEHIGLGFYGDIPMEQGDIEACTFVRSNLVDGGLFMLTIPFGMPRETKWGRYYQENTLFKQCLKQFDIIDSLFYRWQNGWIKCSMNEAEIQDPKASFYSAVAVALVTAKKTGDDINGKI